MDGNQRYEWLRLVGASLITILGIVTLIFGWIYIALCIWFVGVPMLIEEIIDRMLRKRMR